MANFNSPKEHALVLAMNALDKITLEGNSKTSSVLRVCLSVASLIGDSENIEWISNELSGYGKDDKVPTYRQFQSGRRNYPVQFSIHRIEHLVDSNEKLVVWSKNKKDKGALDSHWCHVILSRAQDRCLNFLLKTITQLQYSGLITSLIENIQKEVDMKLVKINSEINSELQVIYNNLSSKTPADWSNASNSCRRILKLIADEVFPPMNEPYKDSEGTLHPVKDDDYMNRLLVFIEENKDDKILKAETKLLASYFDNIRELAGKGVHSSITKFEAEQTAIHTYLIISEVVKLMKEK